MNNLVRGSGTAAFNFGGGTLLVNSAFTTTMPIALTGIGGNANVNLTSYNAVSLAGVLSGPGGLNKLGGGTLTLAAANTFAGNTTIAGSADHPGRRRRPAGQHAGLQRLRRRRVSFGSLTTATFGGLEGSQNLPLTNIPSAPLACGSAATVNRPSTAACSPAPDRS